MKLTKIGIFAVAASTLAQADITGTVVDESGAPLQNAVVSMRELPSLLSNERTLTDTQGKFVFTDESSAIKGALDIRNDHLMLNGKKNVAIEILDLSGKVVKSKALDTSTRTYSIRDANKLTTGLPNGMYVVTVNIDGKRTPLSKVSTTANVKTALKKEGAKLVLVYGIGRMCHIAFWEPHFATEYATEEEWLEASHRIGANLHPFTIEQNAITSFRSSWPLIPCFANTIGPKIIFGSDYCIGGADGVLSRGMQWQGMSFWMTLRHGPTKAITSSRIPTMPGKLFFMEELAGPLCPDTN